MDRCDLAVAMAKNEGCPDYELAHIARLLRGALDALERMRVGRTNANKAKASK
jgi:hypothetical protein